MYTHKMIISLLKSPDGTNIDGSAFFFAVLAATAETLAPRCVRGKLRRTPLAACSENAGTDIMFI
jgi:hypothetical protein